MTRINCGISPKELTNKHLMAEFYEIIRIPNAIKSGRAKVENIPDKFKLGTGHVKFFYNKLLYLRTRYDLLYLELKNRKYNVSYNENIWKDLPRELYNDYIPTEDDRQIVRQRILERLNGIK